MIKTILLTIEDDTEEVELKLEVSVKDEVSFETLKKDLVKECINHAYAVKEIKIM